MGAINWPAAQSRLHVVADGNPGPVTYAALLGKVTGRTISQDIAASFATHVPDFQVDASADRLSAFIGQCAHESGCFRNTREIWGPTVLQRGYDSRADLGNFHPGEGFKYRGAGWIEVTGKYWFDKVGHALGIDLVGNPSQAGDPAIATQISLAWWSLNGMNTRADTGDAKIVTRKINPGLLGLDERVAFTNIAKGILG